MRVIGLLSCILAVAVFLLRRDAEWLRLRFSSETASGKGIVVSPRADVCSGHGKLAKNPQVQKWIDNNRNKRVLIVQADDREFDFDTPRLSESYVHSSLVGLKLWADMHGYAHIWIKGVPEWPNGIELGRYWNKVPATMIALKLARRAGIPVVVYLDSDVVPMEFYTPGPFNCGLETMLEKYETSFLVPRDYEFWSRLVGDLKIYDESGINSGAIMYDTSESAERLLRYWWSNATTQTSPYERQRSILYINFTMQPQTSTHVQWPLFQFNLKNVQFRLLKLFNVSSEVTKSDFTISGDKNQVAQWKLGFRLFARQTLPHGEFFLDMMRRCCGEENLCERLVPDVGETLRISFTCDSIPHTTLMDWPGDQDRLNWAVTEVFTFPKVVDDLAICLGEQEMEPVACFHHYCNEKFDFLPNAVRKFVDKQFKYTDKQVWDSQQSFGPSGL